MCLGLHPIGGATLKLSLWEGKREAVFIPPRKANCGKVLNSFNSRQTSLLGNFLLLFICEGFCMTCVLTFYYQRPEKDRESQNLK